MSGTRVLEAYTNEDTRHWCPKSQRYAGCDQLMAFLDDGWLIEGDVHYDEYWHGGARRVLIYSVELVRANEKAQMRILGNPVVERFLGSVENPLVPKRFMPQSQSSARARVH